MFRRFLGDEEQIVRSLRPQEQGGVSPLSKIYELPGTQADAAWHRTPCSSLLRLNGLLGSTELDDLVKSFNESYEFMKAGMQCFLIPVTCQCSAAFHN